MHIRMGFTKMKRHDEVQVVLTHLSEKEKYSSTFERVRRAKSHLQQVVESKYDAKRGSTPSEGGLRWVLPNNQLSTMAIPRFAMLCNALPGLQSIPSQDHLRTISGPFHDHLRTISISSYFPHTLFLWQWSHGASISVKGTVGVSHGARTATSLRSQRKLADVGIESNLTEPEKLRLRSHGPW